MKTKGELRSEGLNKRISMRDEEVCDKSSRITDKILGLPEFRNSLRFMCYVDFKKEVSTKRLITQAIFMKKQVAVPYIADIKNQNNIMTAARILDFEQDLEKGAYGIFAPKKEGLVGMDPAAIDCIIVPGVVFDFKKHRIGYGAGYYDRFLSLVRPDCLKIGVAFEIQLVEKIPADTFDFPLDLIVTEDRVIL